MLTATKSRRDKTKKCSILAIYIRNNKIITKVVFTVIFLIVLFITYRQAHTRKFIESADCPFNLPDNLIIGENFKLGYVEVPEFHNTSSTKNILLAVTIFPCSNLFGISSPKLCFVWKTILLVDTSSVF